MKKQSNLIYFIVTFLFLIFFNYYFSNLIAEKLVEQGDISYPLVNLILVHNTGAAFSILQGATNLLIIFSIIVLILIIFYVIRNLENISKKAIFLFSMLGAGVVGNLYERIFLGYVRDFFDLTFLDFPIFNVSDIFISVSVFCIILLILFSR
ncbi:MAG: signal peptidase II, partial [bacterium]|nr:signal peptidase II [bacterium]